MNNFTEQDNYSLEYYTFEYHHPTAAQPGAKLRILNNATGAIHKEYNAEDNPVGLAIENNELLIGTADFGSENDILTLDLSMNATSSSFALGNHPVSNRLGGYGLEDLRDAARIGTVNKHYFYLKVQAINISFSTSSGLFEVEILDTANWVDGTPTWYEKETETV